MKRSIANVLGMSMLDQYGLSRLLVSQYYRPSSAYRLTEGAVEQHQFQQRPRFAPSGRHRICALCHAAQSDFHVFANQRRSKQSLLLRLDGQRRSSLLLLRPRIQPLPTSTVDRDLLTCPLLPGEPKADLAEVSAEVPAPQPTEKAELSLW